MAAKAAVAMGLHGHGSAKSHLANMFHRASAQATITPTLRARNHEFSRHKLACWSTTSDAKKGSWPLQWQHRQQKQQRQKEQPASKQ
mmetsp:Transcript_130201/g.253617  ORF Transcript_130201/g.253617 Transcript_130201/m.253617 type:complete len:87 (-) Transcript_130201:11-271(-)